MTQNDCKCTHVRCRDCKRDYELTESPHDKYSLSCGDKYNLSPHDKYNLFEFPFGEQLELEIPEPGMYVPQLGNRETNNPDLVKSMDTGKIEERVRERFDDFPPDLEGPQW